MELFEGMDFNGILSLIKNFFGFDGPLDILKSIIDIGIVSYVVYKLIILVKETRAMQLIKGIVVILIASQLSKLLGLKTIAFILQNSIQLLSFAFVVLFQPELRRGLEQIGRSRFKDIFNFEDESLNVKITSVIEEIVKTCVELSNNYIGALIVIERETKIGEIINTGIQIDASITSQLMGNIFTPNTPLHDGALIIRDNKIKAAGCFLPLTENSNLSSELGTRHRAALGITEVSDCIAIVVSEESGKISFALNGGLTRNLNSDILRKALIKNLVVKKNNNKKITLWKVKSK